MRILIVTWAWPPIGRIGALRPLGMAREWKRLGHEVHVLTGPGDRGGEYCPDLQAAGEQTGARVHRAACPGVPRPEELLPAYEQRTEKLVARRISRVRQIAGQWKGFPDLQRSWVRPATALATELHARHRFDVVWSTSPPESVHFVGRSLAKQGLAWVPDFRDQWSEYLLARWDPVSRWIIDRITALVLAPARAVTANTLGVCESIARASGRRVSCIRNGWDPPPMGIASVRPRSLGYFGRIDPEFQHPERLWEPLRRLRAAGTPWTLDIFAAPGGGGGAALDIPGDLAELISVRSPLPHPEVLLEMRSMAALLVLGWEALGGEAAVAGKLFEYIGAGRPVLAVTPPHYEVARLLAATGLGVSGWSADDLVEALCRLETFVAAPSARLALSREATARELATLLEAARAPLANPDSH